MKCHWEEVGKDPKKNQDESHELLLWIVPSHRSCRVLGSAPAERNISCILLDNCD